MINLIRFIFKAKIFFLAPKKKDILIFDRTGHETLVDAIGLEKNQFHCCSARLEDLNLFVLFKIVINFQISYKSYLKQYIKTSNPKIVLTFIDNNLFFYELKKNFPNIKFISVQNGYRFLNDEMLSKLHTSNKKKEYSADYYLVFNNQIKKIMEEHIKAEYIVTGSLKNNKLELKEINDYSTGNIGFISRFTPAISNSLNEKNENNPDYIVHKFSKKLLINTAEYCKRHKKKLVILTSKPVWIDSEKNYYKNILTNYDYDYLIKKDELDSYRNLSMVDILVSPSSTLGSEALGRGYKVLYFSEDKILGSNLGWPFIKKLQGPFYSNNHEYQNVESMINYLINLNRDDWRKILQEYEDYTCAYDPNNNKLKNIIKNSLINSE